MSKDSVKGRRHMTPAQMDKRRDIAEAIHREHPDMPMAKKMKITTAQAMGTTKHGRRR